MANGSSSPVYNGWPPGSAAVPNWQYIPSTTTTPNITISPNEIDPSFMQTTEQIDWAKFAMWLKGFLSALEGKPLAPEDVEKIMEKLAYVDPDKKLSYQTWISNTTAQYRGMQPGSFISAAPQQSIHPLHNANTNNIGSITAANALGFINAIGV